MNRLAGVLPLAVILVAPRTIHAQPLYQRPAVGRLEMVRTTYDPEVVAAIDPDGRVLTRNRTSGELRCYAPGAGAGEGRVVASTSGALGLSEDQRTAVALVGSTGNDTLRVAVITCDGTPPREMNVYAAGELLVGRAVQNETLTYAPSGEVCFAGDDALWCFDSRSTDAPVTPRRRVSFADLDGVLRPERFGPIQPRLRSPPPESAWAALGLAYGASGRLFALVRKAWRTPGEDIAAKWVIEVPATGSARNVAGPFDASVYPRARTASDGALTPRRRERDLLGPFARDARGGDAAVGARELGHARGARRYGPRPRPRTSRRRRVGLPLPE